MEKGDSFFKPILHFRKPRFQNRPKICFSSRIFSLHRRKKFHNSWFIQNCLDFTFFLIMHKVIDVWCRKIWGFPDFQGGREELQEIWQSKIDDRCRFEPPEKKLTFNLSNASPHHCYWFFILNHVIEKPRSISLIIKRVGIEKIWGR